MDEAQAVIAMRKARDRVIRAQHAVRQSPDDREACREANMANADYRDIVTRAVPEALRYMAIPARRLTVGMVSAGSPESEWLTVAVDQEIHVRPLRGQAQRRALRWLTDHGHAEVVQELQRPSSNKQQEIGRWRAAMRRFVEEQLDLGAELDLVVLGVTTKPYARFVEWDQPS